MGDFGFLARETLFFLVQDGIVERCPAKPGQAFDVGLLTGEVARPFSLLISAGLRPSVRFVQPGEQPVALVATLNERS